MGWMYGVCGILGLIAVGLGVKVWLLRRAMDEIGEEFRKRLEEDTNNLICLSTRDSHAKRLASEINEELRELRRLRQRYLEGDRELKEAVVNISHDLRTPLTAICGYLELLEGEEMPETVRRCLGQIENRTEVMKALTEELFRYSVIASVRKEIKGDVVVNGVLEESLVGCYGALKGRGIEPVIEITEKEIHRELDRGALGRVFENILSNALKYSDGDLEVRLAEDGTVSFTNQARGLTPVLVERLFDRFYTVETGRNSTGLGLSIAKLLTERMGGTIAAEYEEERLTIRICFPEKEEK